MDALTLWVDHHYISPYALCTFVALEEKQLPYTLRTVSLPKREHRDPHYGARTSRIPSLQHGDYWLAESVAIVEYLAETFPFPHHPRLFPADLRERGICREVMGWVRTSLAAIREERSTETVFYEPTRTPLSESAKRQVDQLVRYGEGLIAPGQTTLFAEWCIADLDLAMMLRRLHANGDPLPPALVTYVEANWARPSLQKWCALERPVYTPY